MADKYRSIKCFDHLDVLAKGKQIDLFNVSSTLDRRKSASMVKVEIENERRISLHVYTIRKRAYEVGRVARKRPYVNKIDRGKRSKFAKEMLEKPVNNIAWSNE